MIAFTVPAGSPINEAGVLGPGNIGGVTPNKPGVVFDPGVGRMLTGNSDIVLQMHYTTNGKATTDKTAGRAAFPEGTADDAAARRQRDPAAVRDPGRRAGARSARLARAAGRHHHHVVHAAHARARQGHDLHREVSRRPHRGVAVGAEVGLQLADHVSVEGSEADAEGHRDRSRRALRQLAAEQVQSRSDEGRPLGRSDVGRDDDRLLGHGRRQQASRRQST